MVNIKDSNFLVPDDPYNFAVNVVDKHAEVAGKSRAMLWSDVTDTEVRDLSYEYFSQKSHQSAILLRELGIRKGDKLMLLLSRVSSWWEIATGALRAGVIVSPCSSLATSKDIEFRARVSEASIFVGDAMTVAAFLKISKGSHNVRRVIQADGDPIPGVQQYQDLMAQIPGHRKFHGPITKSSDPAFVFFTSGTTGPPKMVVHNHAYSISHVTTGKDWLLLEPGKLYWNLAEQGVFSSPSTLTTGLMGQRLGWAKATWAWFAAWNTGAALYVRKLQGGFSAQDLARTLHRYPITTLCAGPTIYRQLVSPRLLEKIAAEPFSRLHHCVAAGEALERAVIDSWKAATGIEIKDGYGQTETPVLCGNFVGNAVKPGSMGLPASGIPLSIVNDVGEECPINEEGNIAVALYSSNGDRLIGITDGYLQPDGSKKLNLLTCKTNPDEPAHGGKWYLTGDRGYRDEDGYFWFIGRADDVINSSGYRIGPSEVEAVLQEHPAVQDVAVVGSPSAERGEVVKAFVVLTPEGLRESPGALIKKLQDYCKKEAAPYKYPRKIQFVGHDFFPRTSSGKIQRAALRKLEKNPATLSPRL
ncbi:unnamed protein product [Clonostachys rosea]|uniref:medium-chain acyl-CoA ligase n=1 Tax=Bionectria ochroleuca TaxID=29856 RepID=A0ABY6TR36_BIOOC|nr:unnamed protein product [Clonostachys rosea]